MGCFNLITQTNYIKLFWLSLPFWHKTSIYATPCNSLGTVTLKAEEEGFGSTDTLGDVGGLLDALSSSSAFVTSNIPVCAYLDPATR